jgi:catalase
VFFVRDPMKFQHFIRPQKRRADTNLRDHDMHGDSGRYPRSQLTR